MLAQEALAETLHAQGNDCRWRYRFRAPDHPENGYVKVCTRADHVHEAEALIEDLPDGWRLEHMDGRVIRQIIDRARHQGHEEAQEGLEDQLAEAMEAGVLPDDFYETYPSSPYGPEETDFNTRGYAAALAKHVLKEDDDA